MCLGSHPARPSRSARGRASALPAPISVHLLYANDMTPPTKRKPGRPLRFPARLLVFVTLDTKRELEATAERRQLGVPDVVRQYIREGLAREGTAQ